MLFWYQKYENNIGTMQIKSWTSLETSFRYNKPDK